MSIHEAYGYEAVDKFTPGKIINRKCLRISGFAVGEP
jgi:hypothetical protein